jgi:hypothetical protein
LLGLLGLLTLLSLLSLLTLLGLLLGLGRRIRSRVATVLAVVGATESRLVMQRATLGVLAKVIRSIVTSKRTLLRNSVVLTMGTLLSAVLLSVDIIRVSFLLVGSVIVGVVGWGRGISCTRLLSLRLGSLGGISVERRLRRRGGLRSVERVVRLVGGSGSVLGTKSAVLLGSCRGGLGRGGSCRD